MHFTIHGLVITLCFSTFLLNQQGFTKNKEGRVRGTSDPTEVDNPVMVASGHENADTNTGDSSKKNINFLPSKQSIREAPYPRQTDSPHVSLIREQFQNRGLSTAATEVLEAAWRTSTRKQYEGHLEKWRQYCRERNMVPFSLTVEEGINFLAGLFEKGLGYSGLNTARSALSSIITLSNNINFGTHPLVCPFLKGVFENCPSLQKYNSIWDVRLVLDYLKTFQNPENLPFKMLTLKLTMLLALISAQRCQTLQALSLDNMCCADEQIVFYFKTLLKTSRSGKHLMPLVIKAYLPDAQLCPFKFLKE